MIVEVDELTRYAARQEVKRFIQFCRNRAALHAAAKPKKREAHRPVTEQTEAIIDWIRANPSSTTPQVCEALNITERTFYGVRNRRKTQIISAGRVPNVGKKPGPMKWKVAD